MGAKLTTLDMFAGIGGFSLGLERAGGFETVGFIEIDPFCRRVLAKHWPDVPCHDDVTTREYSEGEADVITAGFPCQDISLAGAGAGLAGARSGLYREVVRAIRLVRPLYAVLENVAALLGRGLDKVLGDLAEVGYDAEWHCIPASAVGAPHRRDRIWIVASPGGEQHEGYRTPLSGPLSQELSRTAADAPRVNDGICHAGQSERQEPQSGIGDCSHDVADANSNDVQRQFPGGPDAQERCGPVAGPTGPCGHGDGWWAIEPAVRRVAHGIPQRVDRLRSLGNSVVPQIPEIIGRATLASRQSEAA